MRLPSVLAFSFVLLFACHDKEEVYPIEPHIEFEGVKFIDSSGGIDTWGSEVRDTLKLTFNFTDGDADFGFLNDENKFPYQERSYFLRSNGSVVPSEKLTEGYIRREDLLNYKDRSSSPNDTLPPYKQPFNCLNWEVFYKSTNNVSTVLDTLYFQINPNHYNIDIDFLSQQSDGSFVEFDFRKEFCTTYDSRSLATNGNFGPVALKLFSSKRGTITYSMTGNGFNLIFGNKPMKLRFFIKDRALHQSNIIETPVFMISGS